MSDISYSRRHFGKIALGALPAARSLTGIEALAGVNSKFKGVQIGAITYSFRSMPAKDVIPAMVKVGLSEAELMSNHCEALAGAPEPPGGGRGPGRGPGG